MKYVCILQIEELNLDNTRGSTEIEGLTEEYTALHTLSLIKIGLTSLKGFPKLPNLTKVMSLKNNPLLQRAGSHFSWHYSRTILNLK